LSALAQEQVRSGVALWADGNSLTQRAIAPRSLRPGEIAIRVGAVGICRTDLYVIDGTIPARFPVIPGHEFSGEIEAVGNQVQGFSTGDRVAVNPVIPCGDCQFCRSGTTTDCQSTSLMGVDLDGACCTMAVIPAAAAFTVPKSIPFEVAAFAEPVAASLAVLKGGIAPSQAGLIAGENRISRLTQRILQAKGFRNVLVCGVDQLADVPDSEFDFVIETHATTDALRQLVRIIRPRGRVILKSRQFRPVELTLKEILPKEPHFQAVNYGRFDDAVAMLADGTLDVTDLIGTRYPLAQFADAIAEAGQDEDRKTFLIPGEVD
jgi:threonine dehydrogenase-like Zn-dependent dehydrogenase